MNVINHSNNKVVLVLKCKNTIGESCFWDPRDNQLWWTDIEEKKIWSLNEDGHSKVFNLPDRAGFILPRKEPGFIIGFPKNISIANQDLTSFTIIQEVETDITQTRINDAKIDPYGGVVFGTFDETSDRNKRRPIGSVYRLSPNGLLTKLFNQVTVSNGIAFSPNGKTMYFTDTPNDIVRKFQIDHNFNSYKELEVFINKNTAPGFPDGGTCDSHGNYWSARVRGGCVVCYNDKGQLISKIDTPSQTPTCLAFGGRDLKTLYITSLSSKNHSLNNVDDIESGNVFSLNVQTPGLKQSLAIL